MTATDERDGSAGARWPDITDAVRDAADDPRAAESRVVALAADLPVRSVPEFLEHACRVFQAAGHTALATAFLVRARKVEETHHSLLGVAPDTARAHRTLLDLVPTGAVTPSLLHDHLTALRSRIDRAGVQAEAREIVEAFLAAGTIPYPNLMADLAEVADAAGADRDAEEDWYAERLLRGGLLPRAVLPVWESAGPALRRSARDPELVDLLVAAEPEPVYGEDDAHFDDRRRLLWLDALGAVGAGARLTPDWFSRLGPAPAHPLVRLAAQAAERLFPPPPGVRPDPGADPLPARAGAHPPAFREQDAGRGPSAHDGPGWDRKQDFTDLTARLRNDPDRFREDLRRFVRSLNRYGNVDYPAALRRFCAVPELRRALAEEVRAWLGEGSAGDLLGLEIALPHLLPLVDAGHADIDPGAYADLSVTDPVEAVHRALRTGLPEELDFPAVEIPGGDASRYGKSQVRAVQHGDLLTLHPDWGKVEVHGPGGVVQHASIPAGVGLPWYDGESFYISGFDEKTGLRTTFRWADEGKACYDPAAAARWPDAPSAAQVTFPGGTEPAFVRLVQGMIHIMAPDGTLTARLDYRVEQPVTSPVLPPPGWWSRPGPADRAGSETLRGLPRETVEELVNAALRGPEERAAALGRLLPSVTSPRLRDAIDDLVRRAADLLPQVLRLHDRVGTARPARLPSLIRSESGLRAGRKVGQVVAVRVLAEALERAAATPAAGTARPDGRATAFPVATITLPPGTSGIWFPFGELGGTALMAAWPWTPEYERSGLLDTLGAWGDTPWGDGSGRWRLHSFTSRGGTRKPEGEVWRTPNGALVMLSYQGHPDRESKAVEYSPDGRFEPFDMPGWAKLRPIVAQGWGGADRIAAFLRLLDERGPAPYDTDGVRALADRTGLPLPEVASAAFGFPYFVGWEHELKRYPQEILDLFTDPETGERTSKSRRSYRLDRELREWLMPDDPAELWTSGLDYDRAAEWWLHVGALDDDG